MRLTAADHVLINGLAIIASPRRYPSDPADVAMIAAIIGEALPRISHADPAIAALAAVARQVVAHPPHHPSDRLVFVAEAAMDGWHRARMAAAIEHLRRAA